MLGDAARSVTIEVVKMIRVSFHLKKRQGVTLSEKPSEKNCGSWESQAELEKLIDETGQ
jgi:hypothetical protein